MRHGRKILASLLWIGAFAVPALAQQPVQAAGSWWMGAEFGAGQLKLSSDQSPGERNTTFAMGALGGYSFGSHLRIGAEVNGWLLQAFDLNNPAVGESVSNVMGIADLFPIARVPIFVRAGAGVGHYENARPEGYNGSGWSWTAGAGYEFRVLRRVGLAPMVAWSTGHFGDVHNPITVETGRRFSVVEFKLDILYHFGKKN